MENTRAFLVETCSGRPYNVEIIQRDEFHSIETATPRFDVRTGLY